MAMAMRRYSLVVNSGRRLSDGARRLRSTSTSVSRKPILHLKTSASKPISVAGSLQDDEPSILDPVEVKEEPTEIQTPMQIYPTTQGRYIWSNWDWMVTSLGFTFSVSALIRGPFLCARYGGFAFILMYVIMAVFLAIPCCFLEAIVGQFTRSGSLSAWKISPLFKGLGFCFLLLNFLTTFFDNVMTTWALSYLVTVGRSIFGEHDYDWVSCTDEWNSKVCIPYDSKHRIIPSRHDSNAEYFRGRVLGQRDLSVDYGLGDMTFPGLEVALTLAGVTLAVFVLAFAVGSKGLSRFSILMFGCSSSFIWFLVIRTMSLPGGSDGLNHFLAPQWDQLGNCFAWIDAARLVCTTCGVGLGIHLSQASYNQFSTPILLTVIIPIFVSTLYSIFASVAIFSLFGFSAKITGRNIKDIIELHPEFVFEYIPITLPYDLSFPTHFYISAFFLIIFCTGIFGTIVRLVNLRLCLEEVFGESFSRLRNKWLTMAALTLVSYFLNLPLISNAALPWIALHQLTIDNIAQPFLIFMEVCVIAWVVGVKSINEAHISCTGKKVGIYFAIWWKFVIPPFVLVLLMTGIAKPDSFPRHHRATLPSWTSVIGCLMVLFMIAVVVGTGLWTYAKYNRTENVKLKRLILISPDYEHDRILETKDGVRKHLAHYTSLGATTLRYVKPSIVSSRDREGSEDAEYFPKTPGYAYDDDILGDPDRGSKGPKLLNLLTTLKTSRVATPGLPSVPETDEEK